MTETQIIENEKNLLTAFQNCSVEILDQLIHESAIFVLPNGKVATKRNVLDNYRSGKMSFTAITPHDQKIQLIDDTAVISVILDMNGKYLDEIVSRKFQYIRVWKLVDKAWKVIAVSGVQI